MHLQYCPSHSKARTGIISTALGLPVVCDCPWPECCCAPAALAFRPPVTAVGRPCSAPSGGLPALLHRHHPQNVGLAVSACESVQSCCTSMQALSNAASPKQCCKPANTLMCMHACIQAADSKAGKHSCWHKAQAHTRQDGSTSPHKQAAPKCKQCRAHMQNKARPGEHSLLRSGINRIRSALPMHASDKLPTHASIAAS